MEWNAWLGAVPSGTRGGATGASDPSRPPISFSGMRYPSSHGQQLHGPHAGRLALARRFDCPGAMGDHGMPVYGPLL